MTQRLTYGRLVFMAPLLVLGQLVKMCLAKMEWSLALLWLVGMEPPLALGRRAGDGEAV